MTAWLTTVAFSGAITLLQLFATELPPGAPARGFGLFRHYNELGGAAAVALAPALAVVFRPGRNLVWKIVGLTLITSAVLLSGSVSALVAAVISVGVWAACSHFSISLRSALVMLGVAAIGLIVILVLMAAGASTPFGRVDGVIGGGGTLASRLATYEQAWWFISLDPMVGAGLDQGTLPGGYVVHSYLFSSLFEGGIVGTLGLLVISVSALATGVRASTNAVTDGQRQLAVALVAALAAFGTLGLVQPLLLQRWAWVPTALLIAMHAQQLVRLTRKPLERTREARMVVRAMEERRTAYRG